MYTPATFRTNAVYFSADQAIDIEQLGTVENNDLTDYMTTAADQRLSRRRGSYVYISYFCHIA